MSRFWVSWWSERDTVKTPFDCWVTGSRCSNKPGLDAFDDDNWTSHSRVALIDAGSEDEVWEGIARYFPDLEQRFCEPVAADYDPSSLGRFTGGSGRTTFQEGEDC